MQILSGCTNEYVVVSVYALGSKTVSVVFQTTLAVPKSIAAPLQKLAKGNIGQGNAGREIAGLVRGK